jgi:tetratricopeptide (TPR) repeat protein
MRAVLAQNFAVLQRLERLFGRADESAAGSYSISRAEALYALGVSKFLEGDIDGARYCQERALQFVEHLSDASGAEMKAKVLHQLGRLTMNEDRDEARRYFQLAYDIRATQHRAGMKSLVTSLLGLGDLAPALSEAMDCYERALRMAQTNQDDMGTAWSQLALASRPLYEQSWEVSQLAITLTHLRSALDGFSAINDPTGLFAVLGWLARLCHLIGYSAGATRMLELEATLRQDYSARPIVEDNIESTREFVAISQFVFDQVGRESHAGLELNTAVAEAEELIRELPKIAGREALADPILS